MVTTHTILFLAANPRTTDHLALDEEARAIGDELERSGHREYFEFKTRWAARPLDLLRALQKLRPSVIHLSGHGRAASGVPLESSSRSHTEAAAVESTQAFVFHDSDGLSREVESEAIARTFEAAGGSVKVVVLSACYSDLQADALVAHVDCVVGMAGAIPDNATRTFAIGFYGGLGNRQSVAAAYKSGCAAILLENLPYGYIPQLKVRRGLNPDEIVLGPDPR